MKKADVKKLKKGQKVMYGGYEWKFHSAVGYVSGINKESRERIENKEYDGYYLWLKAIDGKKYPYSGICKPKLPTLINQYWLGVYAHYKSVEI